MEDIYRINLTYEEHRELLECFVKSTASFERLKKNEILYKKVVKPKEIYSNENKIKAMQKATETRSNKAKKKIDKAIKTLQAQNKVITHYSIMKESSVAFQTVKKYIDESLLKSLNETDNLTLILNKYL